MKILAIGDVCGAPGVDLVCKRLWGYRKFVGADLVVLNGENASMRGISPQAASDLFAAGADVITLGNHAFKDRRICNYLDEQRFILRPLNLSGRLPGNGTVTFEHAGARICVITLIGRLFMDEMGDSPFSAVDALLKSHDADIYIVDFHAQATSEKKAMAYFLDGRASVLFGTHTHVQTADERIFKNGLGYITDLGMTGAQDSVIGVKPEQSVEYFLGGLAPRFESAEGDLRIQGALFELDREGRCVALTRVDYA